MFKKNKKVGDEIRKAPTAFQIKFPKGSLNGAPKDTVAVKPLVEIVEQATTSNGVKGKTSFRVRIAEKEWTLSEREYNELFLQIIRQSDDSRILHFISQAHAEKHIGQAEQMEKMAGEVGNLFKALGLGEVKIG